jgi:diadenylate cyclase
MSELLGSFVQQVRLTTLVDIGITALLIYWLFSLIRGTRAVRLVIGVSVLIVVYVLAVAAGLELLTRILQGGAVVGLFALVVIFQPEIRRALERIGRVGSFGWMLSGADSRVVDHVASEVAHAAAELSAEGHGALVVLERETGLEDTAETGVMVHADVSADLIRTVQTERYGTRHRAALGIAEQTDAIVIVVSEENGQISLVERSRIVRNLNESQLTRTIRMLLDPSQGRRRRALGGWRSPREPASPPSAVRAPR